VQRQSSLSTLGSGTTVHGFKGLFRNMIVAGASMGSPEGSGPRPQQQHQP
jgi:hypothetical protein